MEYLAQLKQYLESTVELIKDLNEKEDKGIREAFYNQAFGAADFAARIAWEKGGSEEEEKIRSLWEEYNPILTKLTWGF